MCWQNTLSRYRRQLAQRLPQQGRESLRVLRKVVKYRFSHARIPESVEMIGDGLETVFLVTNPEHMRGMGTSIAAGIGALAVGTDAALIVLGDMPELSTQDINRVLAAFDPSEDRAIVRATGTDRTPGQPVLFGRRFFEALQGLEADVGARRVVAEHPEYVVDVALEGDHAIVDLDTPEEWAAWRAAKEA